MGIRQKVFRDDKPCDERFHLALHKAFERARAIDRIITLFDNIFFGFRRYSHGELLVRQAFLEVCRQKIDNPVNLLPGKRLVEDDFIQPVQKFRPEALF